MRAQDPNEYSSLRGTKYQQCRAEDAEFDYQSADMKMLSLSVKVPAACFATGAPSPKKKPARSPEGR